jgi:radical SAM superfamily enzyme YgiQ (UPF0313 family)
MHGHAFRRRSVDNLVAEFAYIQKNLSEVREIFIEDDTFTVDRRRVHAFSEAYRAAGLRISWVTNSRPNIDAQTLKALRACNCRLLCVGFESGNQRVLDAMQKDIRLDRARRFVRDAAEAGVLIHGCFMAGGPGETADTLEATLQYAKELSPDTAQFFPMMVYPGTKAYEWARGAGYLMTEDFSQWNTETGLHKCVLSRPGLSNADLMNFCDRARREYYLRPRYIHHRLVRLLKHPAEDAVRVRKSLQVFWRFLLPGAGGATYRKPDRGEP